MKNRFLFVSLALFSIQFAQYAHADIPVVQHVVIVIQENRTPDNLFQSLVGLLPGVDIATSGVNSAGQTVPLTAAPLVTTYDLGHFHSDFVEMYNGGQMNGADEVVCQPKSGPPCPPNAAFQYVNSADVAPYTFLAMNYGFANRMFQSNQGPSMPAHQYLLGGTSQTTATSGLFESDNPTHNTSPNNGCDAPPGVTVNIVGPGGALSSAFPCFEHQTLTDSLDNPPKHSRSGLTWRYYSVSEGSIWTAPNAIDHMCQPSGNPPACRGSDWTNGHIALNPAQFLSDVQRNRLASVSWVTPTAQESDHAAVNDGSGPSWVASIVNAIGASRYWNNTVILIVWDDWGGWYDHVAPPIDQAYGYYENGFRVPLLVVSAYTPAGYVSNTTHTFGSILKFIETAFGLPLIPPGNFADARSDDLSDFFNFNNPPRSFTTVPAPISGNFFLHDHRPLEGPDDD